MTKLTELVERVKEECAGVLGVGPSGILYSFGVEGKDEEQDFFSLSRPETNVYGRYYRPEGLRQRLQARMKLGLPPFKSLAQGLKDYLVNPVDDYEWQQNLYLYHYPITERALESKMGSTAAAKVRAMKEPTCIMASAKMYSFIVGPRSCMQEAIDHLKEKPLNCIDFIEQLINVQLDEKRAKGRFIHICDSLQQPKETHFNLK